MERMKGMKRFEDKLKKRRLNNVLRTMEDKKKEKIEISYCEKQFIAKLIGID